VGLDLEIITVTEDIGVPGSSGASLVVLVGQEVMRNLARHARGRDDDSLVVLCEQLPVHAGLRVEAFRVGEGRELD
jgi:hypothetical protein